MPCLLHPSACPGMRRRVRKGFEKDSSCLRRWTGRCCAVTLREKGISGRGRHITKAEVLATWWCRWRIPTLGVGGSITLKVRVGRYERDEVQNTEGLLSHIKDLGICPSGYGKQEKTQAGGASNRTFWSISRHCPIQFTHTMSYK